MWIKATDVPKKDADSILERYDQTQPELQRMIFLQIVLDNEALRLALAENIMIARRQADALVNILKSLEADNKIIGPLKDILFQLVRQG